MEVKKIILFTLVTILIPLSCDINQYKRIGDTNFYLIPDWEDHGSYLSHSGGKPGGFYSIKHEGIVKDVYWNQQYLIIKCSKSEKEPVKYWYLLNNTEDYNWKMFEIRQFFNSIEYEKALDSIGVSESRMKHTDGKIPWSLHIFN